MTDLTSTDHVITESPAFDREAARLRAALGGDGARLRRLIEIGAGQAKLHHDLRNALSSAMMVSDRLEESSDPSNRRWASLMGKALQQALTLLESAQTFAAAPPLHLTLVRCVPAALIEQEAAALSADFPKMLVDNRIAADLVIMADSAALARAFGHLLRSAAGAAAKRLEAQAAMREKEVLIRLTDDGYPFRAEHKDGAFTPGSGAFRHGGPGYGLVLAREIIEAHGGHIALREGVEGESTATPCIEITLPA